MPHNKTISKLRFLGLGALTAASVGATLQGWRALEGSEKVPLVDGSRQRPPGGGDWPLVSIVVPARNEERNLPRLLPSLLGQRYPDYEVIVVDDQSDDATPRILAEWAARDRRLKVVRGADLPAGEGWMGKPHAMHQGALAASGEWLLFTDADTVHAPQALSSTVAYALAHDVDCLSILPRADLITPVERLVMPVVYQGIATVFPAYKVNDPNSKVAIANGQYILVRRGVYDAMGGAERVKDKIAEDLEFAKAVKSDGYRLYIADGRHLLRVRMYTNLAEMWEGWSKNVVLSFRDNPEAGLLSVLGVFIVAALPFLLPWWAASALRGARKSGRASDRLAAGWFSAIAAWNVAMPLVYRRRVDSSLGLPAGWTLTQPLGAAIFGLIMLYSIVRLLAGKGVVWKGRTYAHRS
jgi:chlorobactene glucosyltransferase